MVNKINKKKSRKSQKKLNINLKKNKKVGGSETQQVPTLAKLRDTYFDFSEVNLFKRDFIDFMKLVYGTPKNIKIDNNNDLNEIKRIASGIKTQQYLINNHLLIPKNRIYEKNNQGFIIYNNTDKKKLYTFLKPSTYDLKNNLMKNRLYFVESSDDEKIEDFKKFVNQLEINSQKSDSLKKNILKINNTLRNVIMGNKSHVTKDENHKIYIIKIKDLKFELYKNNDLNIQNFTDFKILINDNQHGGSFFEDINGALLKPNEFREKLNYNDLLKDNEKQKKKYQITEYFTNNISLFPIHKNIPKIGGKTYTQLIHENTEMLKYYKNKGDIFNVNYELKKYFPEEKTHKLNLNNDGINKLEIQKKIENDKMKEFNEKLEEL